MKRIYIIVLSIFLLIGVAIVVSFAWFTNSEFVEPDLSGYSISAYFGGGDGSSENPYQIKNPRHLYNLAWLQYLGYFNKPGEGNTPDESKNTLTQYQFEITDDLPMTGWALPPIGTPENPFIGLLNGNGHEISNLRTTNEYIDFGNRHPNSVNNNNFTKPEIIGFIGAIGETSSMLNSGYSISSAQNAVANIKLTNPVINTVASQTLVGIAVGYINGKVEDVGIVNGTISVPSSTKLDNMEAISSYTVAGYAEDGYLTKYSNNKAIVLNPTETIKTKFVFEDEGDVTGWGGSIDMLSLYRRINSQAKTNNSNSKVTEYTIGEIYYYDINGNEIKDKYKKQLGYNPTTTDEGRYATYDISYYYQKYGASGAYLTADTAPTSTAANGYDYLGGLYKTVVSIKVKETSDGYKIKNPDNIYLNLKSDRDGATIEFNSSINSETNASNATIWKETSLGNGFSLSAYNPDDGQLYYLGTSNYQDLTLSLTNQFIWSYESNYGYYCTYNNVTYYLRYINEKWVVSNKRSYIITDNYGNYMKRNDNAINNTDEFTEATKWIFENESTQSGIIYDESDTDYKLYTNGTTLTAGNTGTSWSNTNNKIYNGSNFIVYDGSWKIQKPDTYYIKYNSNYLSINNGSISNETNETEASSWKYSDDTNKKGYLTTTIGTTTYYLSFDNSTTNKLVVTNQYQALQWSNDGDGIYYTNNNVKYYLQYKNNTWQASEAATKIDGYYISYVNNNTNYYLTYNDDESSNAYVTTNISEASIWNYDNNNRLYTKDGNNTYYLRASSNSNGAIVSGQTSTSTTRMLVKNNDYIRSSNNGNYYLVYYNGSLQMRNNQTNYRLSTWTTAYIDDINNTPVPINVSNATSITNAARSNVTKPNTIRNLINNGFVSYTRTSNEVPSLFNYIPLNTDNENVVKSNNTGYIISGGHSGNDGGLTAVDIRVAGESSAYSFASNGRLGSSVNTNGKIIVSNGKDQVYTCDTSQEHVIDTTKYQKYAASKINMESTFQTAKDTNSSRVGGIHFIASEISSTRLVTAPEVLINGETKYNYEMPENSIDFTLKTKGYINFFATLFYGGNTAFFSLHEIKRDSNQKIEEINHIKEIYENPNDKSLPYIYKYKSADKNGYWYSNSSNSLPTGYNLIFNTDWIESPNLGGWDNSNYMTKLYYYEIPVNDGEYALGSVEDKAGGYLLYLDIGANAQEVDRTEIRQKSTFTQYDFAFPKGIVIIQANTEIDATIGTDSLNASLSGVTKFDNSGSIGVVRTSDTVIDVTTNMEGVTSSYIPRTVTLNMNSAAMTAAAVKTTTSIYSQIQYIDHNLTTSKVYKTVLERIKNGEVTENPTVKVYNYSTGAEIDLSAANPEWKLYGIVTDTSGAKKNRSFKLTNPQDNSDGKGSERNTLYDNLITAFNSLDNATDTSLLEFDYDTITSAVNTYSIKINTTLDTSTNTVKYYIYSGNDIIVTTTNDNGSTIYVTTVQAKDSLNNDVSFKINETNAEKNTNITLQKTSA